jgi:hypothetical protein
MTAMTILLIGALAVTVMAAPSTEFQGTITLARGTVEELYGPGEVADLDLASGGSVLRFLGIEPHRVSTGETAFLARLQPGYYADFGVVVADAPGCGSLTQRSRRLRGWTAGRSPHPPQTRR